MLISPQALVHLLPLERPAQKGVSPVDAGKQLPKFARPIWIVEDCKGPGVTDVLDEFQRTGEIFIQSNPERFIFGL